MKTLSANKVKDALLSGREVTANKWSIRINDQDEVELWAPSGRGKSASFAHLDRVVADFCKKAEGMPSSMPKPISYPAAPSGKSVLGPDSSGDKPWTDPKVNTQPKPSGKFSEPGLGKDTTGNRPWNDPAVNKRPLPAVGKGGLPKTDLGSDSTKNPTKWEDVANGYKKLKRGQFSGEGTFPNVDMDDSGNISADDFFQKFIMGDLTKRPLITMIRYFMADDLGLSRNELVSTVKDYFATSTNGVTTDWAELVNIIENELFELDPSGDSYKLRKEYKKFAAAGTSPSYRDQGVGHGSESDPDDEFFPEVCNENWTIKNEGETPSKIPSDMGKGASRIVDVFAKEAKPTGPSYEDLRNASPSKDLLRDIADPEKWSSRQSLKGFYLRDPRGEGQQASTEDEEIPVKDMKKVKEEKKAVRVKENWGDTGYSRDLEAESAEDLYHLTRSLGTEDDYDWSKATPRAVGETVPADQLEASPQTTASRRKKSVDDSAKSYWRDYLKDYGEDMATDDRGPKDRKNRKTEDAYEPEVDETPTPAGQQPKPKTSRNIKRSQQAPATQTMPVSAPPGGAPVPPSTPSSAPQPGAKPPVAPQAKPGTGDEGLKALSWTEDDIKAMDEESKKKILQVQLKKPGAAQAGQGGPANPSPATPPKAAPKAPPVAPQAGPAPIPADPMSQSQPVAASDKAKRLKAFRLLAQAVPTGAPIQTGKQAPAPQAPAGGPVQSGPQAAPTKPGTAPESVGKLPEFSNDTSATSPEIQAWDILNEIMAESVQATTPDQVPAIKAQTLVKRLLTELGLPIDKAKEIFGITEKGEGFTKLFK